MYFVVMKRRLYVDARLLKEEDASMRAPDPHRSNKGAIRAIGFMRNPKKAVHQMVFGGMVGTLLCGNHQPIKLLILEDLVEFFHSLRLHRLFLPAVEYLGKIGSA